MHENDKESKELQRRLRQPQFHRWSRRTETTSTIGGSLHLSEPHRTVLIVYIVGWRKIYQIPHNRQEFKVNNTVLFWIWQGLFRLKIKLAIRIDARLGGHSELSSGVGCVSHLTAVCMRFASWKHPLFFSSQKPRNRQSGHTTLRKGAWCFVIVCYCFRHHVTQPDIDQQVTCFFTWINWVIQFEFRHVRVLRTPSKVVTCFLFFPWVT